MKRRIAVKNIFYFTLGAGVLYSCTDPYKAVKDLGLTKFKFTNDNLSIIDELSRIILPIQNIEAMKEHTTLPFIMNIVHDLYNFKKRSIFESAYSKFTEFFQTKNSLSWAKATDIDKSNFVESIIIQDPIAFEKIQTDDQEVKYFLDILKKENLQYLRTSEYILRDVHFYEMAPGRFDGSYPILNMISKSN